MTNKITPERARYLLNMAHQGAQDGQRPVTVAAKYAPLAEAAYALAQTVAGLRYEYAVQRWTDGVGWETVCVRNTYEQVEALTYLWRDDMYRVARRPVGEWEHAPEVAE